VFAVAEFQNALALLQFGSEACFVLSPNQYHLVVFLKKTAAPISCQGLVIHQQFEHKGTVHVAFADWSVNSLNSLASSDKLKRIACCAGFGPGHHQSLFSKTWCHLPRVPHSREFLIRRRKGAPSFTFFLIEIDVLRKQ
jgi:prepilin-type processing-associated H-X9-DG protein